MIKKHLHSDRLIILDAPSGAGKTTYMKHFAPPEQMTLCSAQRFREAVELAFNLGLTHPLEEIFAGAKVIALDDIDMAFRHQRGTLQALTAKFLLSQAVRGKTVLVAGIDLWNRCPAFCRPLALTADTSGVVRWLGAEDLAVEREGGSK
jgi:hypothetical protein